MCLDSLSLGLPDVVVEAQKVEKPKRGRGRRCLRRNLEKKHQPQQEVEDVQAVVEGGKGAGALKPALVSEDKRIPDLTVTEDVSVSIAEKSSTSKKCTIRATPSQNPAATQGAKSTASVVEKTKNFVQYRNNAISRKKNLASGYCK